MRSQSDPNLYTKSFVTEPKSLELSAPFVQLIVCVMLGVSLEIDYLISYALKLVHRRNPVSVCLCVVFDKSVCFTIRVALFSCFVCGRFLEVWRTGPTQALAICTDCVHLDGD